ncbi:MAG TPA: dephospho-CoA kinase [Propylenella sp.]|nr:dephospho-CoA kinase [Propylenella sp.]
MRVIGLTGSIGMGKSTTAEMFQARGVPVHDADRAVHLLYEGAAVAPLEAAFPGIMVDGRIDRARLSKHLAGDPQALARLEEIVHPLVRENEAAFLDRSRREGRRLALLDVPLLLETGGESRVDFVVVVTAAPEIQRQRVLARLGMDESKFQSLLARQLPDAEKRRRAHFVVDTGRGYAAAARQVEGIVRALAFTA